MPIGSLRLRLSLQQPVRAQDEGGTAIITWSEVAQVWAEVEPTAGTERSRNEQLSGEVSHRIRIRYLSGVSPAMRFVAGTRVFEIIAVMNQQERNHWLVCLCREEDL